MKEKIIFICALVALTSIVIKSIKTKKTKPFYLAILFAGTMLWYYPFRLPPEAGFTAWSALCSWIVFRDPGRKDPNSSLNLVGCALIVFTIAFLLKTLIDIKVV